MGRVWLGKVRKSMDSLLFAAQSDISGRAFDSARERNKAIAIRGEKLVSDCLQILTSVITQASCHECNRVCNRFPGAEQRSEWLWVEVAGTPCIPFVRGGAYGTGLAWLHETTIPFLGWGCGMRQAMPDMILHECVEGFTESALDKVLNKDQALYNIQSVVFSPDDMGYAVRRVRRYTLCVLKASCSQMEGLHEEKILPMLFAVARLTARYNILELP